MPKYSIIIPTFNDSARISRAVNSVIMQRVDNWELIVVDDGSTDDTSKIIEPFLIDPRISYVKKVNAGVAAARNYGFENSKGEFIIFLDSDDEIKLNSLSDFDHIISSESNIGLMSCGVIEGSNESLPCINFGISKSKYLNLSGAFCIKREVFYNCGRYDQNLKQSENWEMMARAVNYCEMNYLRIESIDSCNLIYHHQKTPAQTKTRDLYRAEATLYLAQKYADKGVLHFKKDEFLISAAVNFTRAGKMKKADKIFKEILLKNPNISNLIRLFIFKIPFLRNKKWVRNNSDGT